MKAVYRLPKRYHCLFLIALLLCLPIRCYAVASGDLSIAERNNLTSTTANDATTAILNKMKESVLHSDYQIYFTAQDVDQFSTAFKYNHLGSNQQYSANLLYLEGAAKEIILHKDMVSYFQSDTVSFSLAANRIIEAFPDVIYSDFNELAEYYDFVLLGKARTANRSSQLIRIIPKDKDRYHYVIWIDDETYLPLRIDLLDLDSNLIRQVKVLSLKLDFDKTGFEQYINNRDYPIIYSIDKENSELNKWQPTWLPIGFKEKAAYNISFYDSDIDTRLFSDGIFSFTVNVSEQSKDPSDRIVVQGARTVYSTNINNMNIIIIGDLPVGTMMRIAKSIKAK